MRAPPLALLAGPLLSLLLAGGCPAPEDAPSATAPRPDAGGPGGAPLGPAGGAPLGPPGAPPGGSIGPPGGPPGGPGGGPLAQPEDLASTWRPALAVAAPALPSPASCPDADGDGFPSAVSCPALPPEQADCDDSDAAVTPATERWVPPGPFLMGSASAHAGADERPAHVVSLSGYCLDRDEVTVEAWASWLRAAGRSPQGADVRSLTPDQQPEPGRAQHPAEGLTWEEARDYCLAQGKALPTEAQWEKAARGGCERGADPAACDPDDLRPYPWGAAAPDCAYANHQATTGGAPRLCVSDTLPADALPAGAGPYGHRHLAGNVWEYVADAWHPAVYGEGAPRTDPGGPAAGAHHVLRGGSWNTFSTNMRAANRFHDLVMGSASGVRCARPTAPSTPDAVAPLALVPLSGTLRHATGSLDGRALYVTAFAAEDVDPATGGMGFGRSPVAEVRLAPTGEAELPFTIEVPAGGRYHLTAALDAGTGAQKDGYVSASGSGGFGEAPGNPIAAEGPVAGLRITITPPPAGLGPAGPPPGDVGPAGPPPGGVGPAGPPPGGTR